MTAVLEVLVPGLLTTVQDAGRPDAARLGVPPAGACDPRGLMVANALLENPPGAPAVEITLGGVELTVRETTVLALGGADLGAVVVEEGRALAAGASHLVWAGQTIRFIGRRAGIVRGARAYLALPGGIDVPEVLGSASTCLVAGFGGVDGRRLRVGDLITGRRPSDPSLAGRAWPGPIVGDVTVVRVVAGPHGSRFGGRALDALTRRDWVVRPDSDRMGIRLSGPPLRHRHQGGSLVSVPVLWGAIQVPPDGTPIVLLADHQTVGGYPVLAVAIRADRSPLGQLAPGDPVRFELVDLAGAAAAWDTERAREAAVLGALARDERWHDHWRWAGS